MVGRRTGEILGHGLWEGSRKKIGGYPSHPAYFKQNVVTRTPAVHRKVQANNVNKNSRVTGQLALNVIWYGNWTTIGQLAHTIIKPSTNNSIVVVVFGRVLLSIHD
jgi:hypothetical protein